VIDLEEIGLEPVTGAVRATSSFAESSVPVQLK